jgi:hypothetical protein
MKKILIVAAAAGLMSLAACGSKPAETNVADNLEATANDLDANASVDTNEAAPAENAAAPAENVTNS